MDVYRDAAGLASLPDTAWQPYVRPRSPALPEKRHLLDAARTEPLRRREAARQRTLARQRQEQGRPEPAPPQPQWIAKIDRVTSFESCPVPLDVVLCTAGKDAASVDSWAVMTTAADLTAAAPVQRYGLRTAIEERHRHIKLFWDIADFTSCDEALVVNQVVFTLLTYSLLQMHLLRRGQQALNKLTKSRLLEQLLPAAEHVTVFTDQRYARFNTYEYTVMVMGVPEAARAKLTARLADCQRELYRSLSTSPPA